MVPEIESEDDRMLREREETLKSDRSKQAKWYEDLNLYAEALRVYRSISDKENIDRLISKMKDDYSMNASKLEKQGMFQDAANLYYLIGDHHGVARMKKRMPDLVILYDKEGGGLSQLASSLGDMNEVEEKDDLFHQPNVTEEKSAEVKRSNEIEEPPGVVIGKKGVPVKMPIGKKKKFCPYCGDEISTKKEPRFCPYCGEDLT